MKRVHAVVHGNVHGVFFRAFAEEQANALQLTGWVKNITDGVEVIAEGPEDKLKTFLEKLKQGPPAAKVTKIEHSFDKATGEFKDFAIQH